MFECVTLANGRCAVFERRDDRHETLLGPDRGCDRCCRHSACVPFRVKHLCRRFLDIEWETLEPVEAEEVTRRLGSCLEVGVKRCLVGQEKHNGFWIHTALVECERDVPSEASGFRPLLQTALRQGLSIPGDGYSFLDGGRLCCRLSADVVIRQWESFVDEDLATGDRGVYDDLVKSFAGARLNCQPESRGSCAVSPVGE